MNDLTNAGNKAKQAAEDAKNDAKGALDNIKDKVVEGGEALKEKATTLTKDALEKGQHAQEYFLELVKSNPYKSIGIAFLAGWLISTCKNKFK